MRAHVEKLDVLGWIKSNEADQKEFNGDIKEDITTNTTETGVMSVHQNVFVDVYHAGYCML